METNGIRVFAGTAALWAPLLLMANSTGPPAQRTGAAADGGLACTACHRSFDINSGAGRLWISARPYTPGAKQNITITLEDPDAERWGFQLTARLQSDPARQAGSFTAVPNAVRVRCADNSDANPTCNGEREFASHVAASTQVGTRNRASWQVEWTPPASDVGPVVFYFAGNAANNGAGNTGDRIYTGTAEIASSACNLTGTPRVGGVTNAASFATTVNPLGLISVFGSGFAAAGARHTVAPVDYVDGGWPTDLRCVAVEVGGRRAPLLYIQDTLINAQAPALDVTGPVDVRVILNPGRPNEIRTDAARVTMAQVSPAFFATNNRVAAINASRENTVLSDTAPARPGDVVTLFGTGFGATDPAVAAGAFPTGTPRLRESFTMTMGGVNVPAADISYAGLSPAAPGLYQFNVRVPANLPDGNAAVAVRIAGSDTQSGVNIPVRRQ